MYYHGDIKGVKVLLKPGADPNLTGDKNGIAWDVNSTLHGLRILHGISPLQTVLNMEVGKDFYQTPPPPNQWIVRTGEPIAAVWGTGFWWDISGGLRMSGLRKLKVGSSWRVNI